MNRRKDDVFSRAPNCCFKTDLKKTVNVSSFNWLVFFVPPKKSLGFYSAVKLKMKMQKLCVYPEN